MASLLMGATVMLVEFIVLLVGLEVVSRKDEYATE